MLQWKTTCLTKREKGETAMKYIQCFLTVNDGKWLIAEAISQMPAVKKAFGEGTLVLKGGTTVSCVAEKISGEPLRISGRNTKRGAVSGKVTTETAHTMLWKNGVMENLDNRVDEVLLTLPQDTVLVIGANLIDSDGNAAMLAGAPGGGLCGRSTSILTAEGFHVIVAAGLEKLTVGSVKDALQTAKRKGIDSAWGMSCGLFPVVGEVVTELEAVKILANVEVAVIGRGGIQGAEGGTLLQIWGTEEEVEKIEEIVTQCKEKHISGDLISLEECTAPSEGCKYHLSCRYRKMMKK